MSKIAPCLWFDGRAEEAANFYVSLLPNSRIDRVSRYPVDTPGGKTGQVMVVDFTLAGQQFMGLNGGPYYQFTPAISLFVPCADQEEVDRLWDALLAEGGAAVQCGWLTDRYGVSWQVIPTVLLEMLNDPDPEKSRRVMEAMMQMVKIDIAALERAHRGEVAA